MVLYCQHNISQRGASQIQALEKHTSPYPKGFVCSLRQLMPSLPPSTRCLKSWIKEREMVLWEEDMMGQWSRERCHVRDSTTALNLDTRLSELEVM